MSNRLLLIEDEQGVVTALTDRLMQEGYVVEAAFDGLTGLRRASSEPFDLIILDVMLPGKSGYDVCRDLRQLGVQVPILILTARGQVVDKVLGLKLGADDYLTKPFDMIELQARVEALLRRASASQLPAIELYQSGEIKVDFRRAEVYRKGKLVEMSAREFKLLCCFIENRSCALSRDELLDRVWGQDSLSSPRTVDVHIAWLRQKLEVNPSQPQIILTVHGIGYKFAG